MKRFLLAFPLLAVALTATSYSHPKPAVVRPVMADNPIPPCLPHCPKIPHPVK